jgi:hypothetical protein
MNGGHAIGRALARARHSGMRLFGAGSESITTVPAFGAELDYGGYGFRARAKTRAPE